MSAASGSALIELRERRMAKHFKSLDRQYHREVVDRWLSHLPGEYHRYSVANLEDRWGGKLSKPHARRVKAYLEEPTQFMLLKGPSGLGKSTLAASIGTELLKNQAIQTARFEFSSQLLANLSFPGESNPIGRCIETDLLVLDDLGAQVDSLTGTQRRGIGTIINSRWSEGKLTILTSNMSLTETEYGLSLPEWFGPSAWDRITQYLTLIEFEGESFRQS